MFFALDFFGGVFFVNTPERRIAPGTQQVFKHVLNDWLSRIPQFGHCPHLLLHLCLLSFTIFGQMVLHSGPFSPLGLCLYSSFCLIHSPPSCTSTSLISIIACLISAGASSKVTSSGRSPLSSQEMPSHYLLALSFSKANTQGTF